MLALSILLIITPQSFAQTVPQISEQRMDTGASMERDAAPKVRADDDQRTYIDDSRKLERSDGGANSDAERRDLGVKRDDGERRDYGGE